MTNNDIVSSTETIPNVSAEGQKSANVPNLRFLGFDDAWDYVRVSDLIETYSTNSLSWDMLDYENGTILNLHYGLIHSGLPTQIDCRNDKLPFIKCEYMPKHYTLCEEGDIAFADASEDTEEVGKVVEFNKCNEKDIVCGLHTIHARDKVQRTVVGYKGYAFSSVPFHHQIRRIAQGTKIYSINTRNFEEVYIGVPSKAEQRKIADFLCLIDERINTQSKIIKELELLKRRISNTLFDRPAIDERRLETFYSKGKAGGTPTSTKKEYYGGDIPFLSISDMTEQGKYLYYTEKSLSERGLNNSAAWIVPTNSLILSMYASVGLVAINKVPISTSQAMFSMVIEDNLELEYLYYFLSYFKENKLHRLLETGTQSNINADMVKSIKVADFGYEENFNIIKILKSYDEKIQIEKDILSAYKKQKAYLLKEMFI